MMNANEGQPARFYRANTTTIPGRMFLYEASDPVLVQVVETLGRMGNDTLGNPIFLSEEQYTAFRAALNDGRATLI